jgi:small subunit ribosomal protein S20
MANTAQQKKRVRQDIARNTHNTERKSRIRTFLKQFEAALAGGKKDAIAATFKKAMSELAKGARRGVISKGAAARKTSRLAARIGGKSA